MPKLRSAVLCALRCAPQTAAYLVMGLSAIGAPFHGGVFVPAADVLLGPLSSLPALTPVESAGTMPTGFPSGAQFWMQAWCFPQFGQVEFSASSAIVATIP